MSRLGKQYLDAFGCRTWKEAYAKASTALDVPEASFKNLRDEFDPYVSNVRKGWHGRPVRTNRQAVLEELAEVSDAAVLELVSRSLERDTTAIDEVIDLVMEPPKRAHNVAERLLTGRMAEEFFMLSSREIVDIDPSQLRDVRQLACGFDFGVSPRPEIAIEVKGLRRASGGILFTDREWSEAHLRRSNYLLIVVGNLEGTPRARVFEDPVSKLEATCQYVKTASAVWRSHAEV